MRNYYGYPGTLEEHVRKLSRNVAALAAGITLSVVACGDDDGPTGSTTGDALTAVEAQELASEVLGVLFSLGFTGSPSVVAPIDGPAGPIVRFGLAAAAEPIPRTTASCNGGGSVTVSGNVSINSSGTSSTFDILEEINNCATSSGSGTTFTMNGDPNIRMTGSVSIDGQTSITLDLNMNGGIRFSTSDGRSGSCSISISMGGTISLSNPDPNAISVSGTVCGQNINSI